MYRGRGEPRHHRRAEARAQARLAQGPHARRGPLRRGPPRARGTEAPHRLRRGELPEHRRMLGERHRDGDVDGRRLHPGMSLLRRRLGNPSASRSPRAATPRRSGRPAAPRLSRGHQRQSRRIARRRGRALRPGHRGTAARRPAHPGRGAHSGLPGRSQSSRPHHRRRPRGRRAQRGDRRAAHTARARPPRDVPSIAGRARALQARRDEDEELDHARSRRGARRGGPGDARPPLGRLRHPHPGPVSASEREAPSRRRVCMAGSVRGPRTGRPRPRVPVRRRGSARAQLLQGRRVLPPALDRAGSNGFVAMPQWNIIQAVNDALRVEMKRDDRVVLLGEDIGKFGGVFRATAGLYEEFGETRVIDTPLAEGGIIGAAIGMALYGLRPVPEIQFSDFIYPAFDQIVNELGKIRYRSGGQYSAPLVIRTPVGGGIKGGHYHSQSPEALFIHTPGLQVICPSNPVDAKGLLISAIRQDDPVIFMEPKRVYRAARGEVPEGEYTVPIGEARVAREGRGMTVISWGAMFHEAEAAVTQAAELDAELIDLRTLWPLDIETVTRSVRKTGRCAIVQEAPRTNGFAAEISALVQERCFTSLEAPIARITGWDTPFPYTLENEYLPLAPRILKTLRELKAYEA